MAHTNPVIGSTGWGTVLNDALDDIEAGVDAHIADAAAAHAATAIANTPAGSIAATTVQAAIDELDGDVTAHVGDAAGAHAATAISNTPAGAIAATTVQAAIDELDSEKQSAAQVVTAIAAAAAAAVSTTAALEAVGNAVNTTGKYAGKPLFNTTTGIPVWADGAAAADVWVDSAGATAHTPV